MNEFLRRVWRDLSPHLEESGYVLVELESAHQGQSPLLRVYIDKSGGGITLDDCVSVTELISPLLDAGEYLSEHYLLEVSSPGIDRPLRQAEDFSQYAGESIRLVTESPVEGRKRFTGILRGIQDGLISIECEERTYSVHIENVKKANLNR